MSHSDQSQGTSRRAFLSANGTIAAATVLRPQSHAAAAESPPTGRERRVEFSMPALSFRDAGRQNSLGRLYDAALTGLIGINTVYATPGRPGGPVRRGPWVPERRAGAAAGDQPSPLA
ncbi:hypothetical protein Airi01_053510 [Actinoallomurus iriomotensis]|uniref:Uncharacterized protein n=1 Tax=Actinoallomurus iriomotensis TaxID=478107 RepID=A0A9W6RKB3_9ACTN|nr:hypothetical protein Airi01_053510 [Actinoallomurus iriomotensis]